MAHSKSTALIQHETCSASSCPGLQKGLYDCHMSASKADICARQGDQIVLALPCNSVVHSALRMLYPECSRDYCVNEVLHGTLVTRIVLLHR